MRKTLAAGLVLACVLVQPAAVGAFDYGSPCYMAEQYGGKSLYYNVLCFFEWLLTWT